MAKKLKLSEQIVAEAQRRAGGWESAADDLAAMAVEIAGGDVAVSATEFNSICEEVFRTEG